MHPTGNSVYLHRGLGSESKSLWVLLDLSAAFDTVDHGVLLEWLPGLGTGGTGLQWFCSFMADAFEMVRLEDAGSAPWSLTCGMSQGSTGIHPLAPTVPESVGTGDGGPCPSDSSCRDYCNTFYMGLLLKMVQKLQLVQNVAAWVSRGLSGSEPGFGHPWIIFCIQL